MIVATVVAETGLVPAVDQIELHPLFTDDAVRAASAGHGIAVEAHSPLGHDDNPLVDETVTAIPKSTQPRPRTTSTGGPMKLTTTDDITSSPGPADWFTGEVRIDGIRNPDEQSAAGCAHVRFAPGARTAWHHHPKGQTLYVTDGIGLVATRTGGVRHIHPGDVVFIEPGEEHWHGATPNRFMAHVAVQEADDSGQVVTWLDHVTDEEYGAS